MQKIILFTTLLLFSLSCFSQNHSSITNESYHSDILKTEKKYSIYLPAGYNDSDCEYPVLYLLHGAWGGHLDWAIAGDAKQITDLEISQGSALPLIIVMPDASGINENRAGKNMGYFDQPDWEYETHFFEEFIPHIESKYRIKSQRQFRTIAGLSMGGGGSMVYALHRPDLFGSAAPLSGLLSTYDHFSNKDMTSDFNNSVIKNDAIEYVRQATEEQLDALRQVRWYIDCGDNDFLYKCNVDMYVLMREKQIPLQFRMRGGEHNWVYWRESLKEVLKFISIGFAQ